MATVSLDHVDNIGFLPQGVDDDLCLLDTSLDVVLLKLTETLLCDSLTACRVAALDDVNLNAALASVENTTVSLPRCICISVVRHDGLVLVLDDHRQVILNTDALSKTV